MNITKTNLTDKIALYKLTHATDTPKVQSLAGKVVDITKWAFAMDTDKKTGEEKPVVFIGLDDGSVYASISNTFFEALMDMVTILELDHYKVTIIDGESKNGRHFISCELAD